MMTARSTTASSSRTLPGQSCACRSRIVPREIRRTGRPSPQELGLQLEGQLADLVEEEGGAVRDLEAPLALHDGPGEGALLVPEELALDERGGQRRAVELDEGPGPAGAQAVERVGDELLADAMLGASMGRPLREPARGCIKSL